MACEWSPFPTDTPPLLSDSIVSLAGAPLAKEGAERTPATLALLLLLLLPLLLPPPLVVLAMAPLPRAAFVVPQLRVPSPVRGGDGGGILEASLRPRTIGIFNFRLIVAPRPLPPTFLAMGPGVPRESFTARKKRLRAGSKTYPGSAGGGGGGACGGCVRGARGASAGGAGSV